MRAASKTSFPFYNKGNGSVRESSQVSLRGKKHREMEERTATLDQIFPGQPRQEQ